MKRCKRRFAEAYREVPRLTDELAFHHALEALWRAIDHANKYIVVTAPFTLAKDPAQRPRVGAILHHLLEALRATRLAADVVVAGNQRSHLRAARTGAGRHAACRSGLGPQLRSRASHPARRSSSSRASRH